jgi:prepilin-type N-terminal cleavage/methylation domain-containing protein/prepilin-type processing-associated H-X9-DG protein
MTRGAKRGFTLIELLVVIAIIAILAAILFPVFAQAREKARAATCLSNCKQLGTAMMMYVQDYEGTFPPSWFDAPGEYGFDVAIYPYVKNKQVYSCPSNPLHISDWPGYERMGVGPIPRSYAMNGDIALESGKRVLVQEASVDRPAETILMLETSDWYRPQGPDHETYVGSRNDVCYHIPFKIHQGGADYIFVDGHAKWARVEQTWSWWRRDHKELGPPETLCAKRQAGG